ncbi:VirK/YbjX family protein [Yokenella regensburgei]|jgi:hypothetical protein|uniref:Protein of uncharacterized function (DUF535) n=1 Tax=Yokenella regensburgei TaxID=158877 RepID=A0AB38FR49_9ENTR|nr:VirK/YbjX family protein [Yokenella regensburgei]KAF1371159.1 hypothetical protein FHR25_000286 [Yokenella regensburgei]KFD19283.1 VirK family virulence factor [Yokenella regensburgei ATCC 49455]MDQ4431565.1 VirK/YbjX family protein [Yokenella regensburgei]RKR65223.1 hypothetical protein C7387_1947 [Yokenella regensburgei]SQA60039.1 Protein of uncharacterised function (DUF535) [Yokenella regensburgei]
MSSVIEISDIATEQPKSGWQLFRFLCQGKITPGNSWRKASYRRKFMLRSMAIPFSTARLMKELSREPRLLQLLQAQPGLPCRVHRPWLSMNINRRQASKALACHYRTLSRLLPPAVLNGYLTRHGVKLASLTGKDEQTYTIRLGADSMMDKEGEATLMFYDAENTLLAELTFTLCQPGGANTLYIGGLQGPKAHVPHERIQLATKACHGLFPKRLLVEAAMALSSVLSVEEIRAVSNETHIYRSIRYRKKKQDKLHADYNGFWDSLGAAPDSKGDFILPLTMPRKAMEDIASKKRAEYRRRYTLLDSLIEQTVNTIRR